jgi:uncharacterized membrane protein YhaH (DUF805 family)
MSFVESIQTCFSKFVTWQGRAGRAEYWWWALFALIVYIVGAVIDAAAKSPIPTIVLVLVLLLPSLAVFVRRLHDTGRSGWWYWIGLVPLVGGIVLLVFVCSASHGPNNYGNGPAGPASSPAPTTA